MPQMKDFRVTQTRVVRVRANSMLDAIQIAEAAFEHGQDANGAITKDKGPKGVWGNTTSHIAEHELTVQEA